MCARVTRDGPARPFRDGMGYLLAIPCILHISMYDVACIRCIHHRYISIDSSNLQLDDPDFTHIHGWPSIGSSNPRICHEWDLDPSMSIPSLRGPWSPAAFHQKYFEDIPCVSCRLLRFSGLRDEQGRTRALQTGCLTECLGCLTFRSSALHASASDVSHCEARSAQLQLVWRTGNGDLSIDRSLSARVLGKFLVSITALSLGSSRAPTCTCEQGGE
jgi:hypothetical protein